jgi:hypothetical protein
MNSSSEYLITYQKPINYNENDSEFEIFKNEMNEGYKSPITKIFKNVRIATNSVVFNYFKIVKETCIGEENYKKYSKGFKFFFKFIFPKFNFSNKKFILITDEWTSNYYHWHIFALAKLLKFKEKGFFKNYYLILPKKYLSYPYALKSLEKIGFPVEKIVFLRRKSNIKVNELAIIKNFTHQNPEAFNQIREILAIKKNYSISYGSNIYISRSKQVLRFIENEEEVMKVLEKFGFKKVIMEDYSYQQQIEISSQAKFLISSHGAGMTNIMFMEKNSYLLELATKPYPSKPVTDYFKLSSMLNINYLYQECDCGERSKIKDFHHGSLVVDLGKLEKNIKFMLNHAANI